MTLIRKGIEQIRREGIENAQAKIKQQEEYQAKVDSMSKHNVGGLYDVRAILKSQQFKEQKNHYSTEQAMNELEDLLSANRLYKFKQETLDFIMTITGKDYDSYNIRETGKFMSDLIIKLKEQYDIKD
jgi:hypothetical protein|tara:strand:+ start:353 stop:736 length:384 start_codon:yes stop_codon:yes gene_type:complete